MDRSTSLSSSNATSSGRFETFTEAVPLSLSSMAHSSLPLEDGVLDGIRQILSHTLLSCVNYARIVHPPHQWTFQDLTTSEYSWTPMKGVVDPKDLPFPLLKLKFKHQYTRNALIYLKPALPADLSVEEELEKMSDWREHVGVLGRVSLQYVSTEPLTPGEMDGTDVEDIPPCIMYKVIVEYRTLPPTGNQQAVQAEELSMLSFGGSVDDDVKYGALASLYDETAKYVLEIYSVRGKKYKFDLMDSTLSNGTVPRLPSSREGDPFVKSLCLTVTDHNSEQKDEKGEFAVTRLHLLLEGKPRKGAVYDDLPAFDYISNGIAASFLPLNPIPPVRVSATPSGNTLLLDREYAGRVYVNGRYVTTWGRDPRIGSHGVALFGMDLQSIPFWSGRIVDFEALKTAYAQLFHELLIDANLAEYDIAGRLLSRLMKGFDLDEDEDDLYDDEDEYPDVDIDCLESQVLAVGHYDKVGIAPKALATRFMTEFGPKAFPCRSHEVQWVISALPGRVPVVSPERLIRVLRRGGYFDTQKTADLTWFSVFRAANEGVERKVVDGAIDRLRKGGCDDIEPEHIVIVSNIDDDPIGNNAVCRYSDLLQQYRVNENFFEASLTEYFEENGDRDADAARSYLLGLYIAREHPDNMLLARYVLRNKL